MEQAETRPAIGQGLLFAVAIWLIVGVSLPFFFKWGVPDLASDRTGLDTLYYWILGITGVLYVAVQALLGYFVWRFRDRPGAEGSYWHDSHRLEVTWTLATAVVLVPIVFSGIRLWQGVYSPPPEGAYLVEVWGAQFQWDMHYPGSDGVLGATKPELISLENLLGIDPQDPASADDIVRTNELVVPVNRPVHLRLRTKDVQHSFFLPFHRVKQDLVSGMAIDSWFLPTKVGEYEIACAELCGLGHYRMRGLLHVKEQAEVDQWLREAAAQ